MPNKSSEVLVGSFSFNYHLHCWNISEVLVGSSFSFNYNCSLISSGLEPSSNLRSTLFVPITMCVLFKLVLIRYFCILLEKLFCTVKVYLDIFPLLSDVSSLILLTFFEGVYHSYELIISICNIRR